MFTFYDYAIFGAILAISISIGVYFGCFGSKQSTPNEYLLGDKKMKILPIGVSVAVSHFSGVALLGIPADVYRYGTAIFLINICGLIMIILSIYIYLPVFFKLQLSSAYEYLERRFDSRTKRLAVYLYVISEIIFFPLLIYAPALAFSTATGFEVKLVSLVISALCVFYTTIGGLKTVVWTDIFQFVVIIACMVVIYVFGLNATGGFLKVWKNAVDGGRLDLFDLDFDLTKRESFWTIVLGYTVTYISTVVTHQTGVQKFLAVPKFRDCVWSLIYSTIAKCLVLSFCGLVGFAIYTKYLHCDPLLSKKIVKHDQILPYFIMDVAGHIPGIQGVFISIVFCAALSTMSSLLNSMSGVLYSDFLVKIFKGCHSEKTKSNVLKATVAVSGILCSCLVFLIEPLGDIISLSIAFRASTNGPMLGVFTLGMLFPGVNEKGAFYGGLGGLITLSTIMITAKYYHIKKLLKYTPKSLSVEGCEFWNTTSKSFNFSNISKITTPSVTKASEVPFLFRISFHYYAVIGVIVTMTLGIVISRLTRGKSSFPNEDLISPVCHHLMRKNVERRTRNDAKGQDLMLLSNEKS